MERRGQRFLGLAWVALPWESWRWLEMDRKL
jgi:hypothetical protein